MNIAIKRAIITEKSMKMAALGSYTFFVNKGVRKPEIRRDIELKFGVDVVSISTMNYKDLSQIQKSRKGNYIIPGYKKAVVRLKKGQKIALFEPEAATVETAGELEKESVVEKKSLLRGTKVKIEKTEVKKSDKTVKKEVKVQKKGDK